LTALTLLKRVFPAKRVLSLGYPDLPVAKPVLDRLFDISLKETHPQNEEARKRHNVAFDLPSTEEFFEQIGSYWQCVDYKALIGNEIVADLNEPCEFGEYDLVIDPGTLEHCFNVVTALKNAASAVIPGGHIFHCNPLSMVNHGFYMFSPTWYYDFYTHNNWTVLVQEVGNAKQGVKVNPVKRVQVLPELSNYVLAKRPVNSPLIRDDFPIQSKYKAMLA